MVRSREDVVRWLHRLDTYTNAEFGRARSQCTVADECVACGRTPIRTDEYGLCTTCARRREPYDGEIVLFRPMVRKAPQPKDA